MEIKDGYIVPSTQEIIDYGVAGPFPLSEFFRLREENVQEGLRLQSAQMCHVDHHHEAAQRALNFKLFASSQALQAFFSKAFSEHEEEIMAANPLFALNVDALIESALSDEV